MPGHGRRVTAVKEGDRATSTGAPKVDRAGERASASNRAMGRLLRVGSEHADAEHTGAEHTDAEHGGGHDNPVTPVLLAPGAGAVDLTPLEPAARRALFPPGRRLRVFVLDGTWATARSRRRGESMSCANRC